MSLGRLVYVCFFTFFCFLLKVPSFALNTDGVLLLSFKYAILSDPLSVLENWNYDDVTPCSWNGVTCTEIGNPGSYNMFRVTSLVLPNSQLLGSISRELGYIEYLRNLDLSNNFFNGSLPDSIFNATELQILSLSNNVISGELHEFINGLVNLQVLNLSDNALAGKIPMNLTNMNNLTVVSLRSNYFSGGIPGGFDSVEVLDLSSNLLNGSLPLDFGGSNLRYLNISYNKISSSISPEFVKKIPENATIDLSFNNLTGPIPESVLLLKQKAASFSGNMDLCGKPLKNLCSIPSTLSDPPNVSTTTISPAIAVIPKPMDSTPETNSQGNAQNQPQTGLRPGTIAGIAVADLAGIAILAMVILYAYQFKKRRSVTNDGDNSTISKKDFTEPTIARAEFESRSPLTITTTASPATSPACPCSCLTMKAGGGGGNDESTSDTNSSDNDNESGQRQEFMTMNQTNDEPRDQKHGTLVTVDGETHLELETLLKASAYILGASGSSIVYKAVLEDGTAFAVRRIGDQSCSVEKFKDFENQIKAIAKLRHPNLVKVRGFYWGNDEKLVIYDYIPNGTLASSGYKKEKAGSSSISSPNQLSLEARLKIAKGLARGLAYVHDKKQVHANIKPSNILLTQDIEPIITDLGLTNLTSTNTINSKDHHHHHHHHPQTSSSPYALASTSSSRPTSPYQAPESLKTTKPNHKWDVYSFGMVLLELLSGRLLTNRELDQCSTVDSVGEEKTRVLRLADLAIRGELVDNEDVLFACFKIGLSCVSFVPQKRPSMKEVVQVLEKMSTFAFSSC